MVTATEATYVDKNFGNRQVGSLVLAKSLTGGPSGYTGPFRIDYDCTGSTFDGFENVAAGGFQTVPGIPAGTVCTVSETTLPLAPAGYSFDTVSHPTYTDTSGATNNDGIVTIPTGASVTVTVNNALARDAADATSLSLAKSRRVVQPATRARSPSTTTVADACL